MSESDGDIEYLDEDAEIVQQCVQTVQPVQQPPAARQPMIPQLVVRRSVVIKRKKRKEPEDSDSDYDPNEDYAPLSPPSPIPRPKKKKICPPKKPKTHNLVPPNITIKVQNIGSPNRKTCNIRIPDYDDPLCLPVKAIMQGDVDMKRLRNWNNVCLEHFKHYDALLKPEKGDTRVSIRTMIFKNLTNKASGNPETTIWTKTCVENEDGDRKSEIFQSVLPRFREKKVLNFNLIARKPRQFSSRNEVILSKEESKDEEVLVAYKPSEALAAVYKMVKPRKEEGNGNDKKVTDETKMFMKELTCCKMCAPCFQTSWRGVRNTTQKSISCPVCRRTSVTVYNLLAHFKTHGAADIKPYKQLISSILAETVDYHYKCRVCRERCPSIKELRKHVKSHNGTEAFICEIGDHVVQ